MPYYKMHCQNPECGHSDDMLMKYDEMKAGVSCEKCENEMRNQICAPISINDFGSGPKTKRAIAPDVGPLSKKTKAYEKKMDDENSTFYKPGEHHSMTSVQRKTFKETKDGMDKGQTNFTK